MVYTQRTVPCILATRGCNYDYSFQPLPVQFGHPVGCDNAERLFKVGRHRHPTLNVVARFILATRL
jgi:hypothetical protein